ncbi:hypothetical protein BH23CHL2_BH23CHL2_06110 [soil metagenome]
MTLSNFRNTLTRRALIGGLIGMVSSLVAACSGPARPGSSQSVEPDETATATATATEAGELAREVPGPETSEPTTAPAPTSAPAETPGTSSTPPVSSTTWGAVPAGSAGRAAPAHRPSLPREIYLPFAAVVSRKLQVRDISYEALVDVWNLRIDNWRELGDPVSSPVRRYTFPDTALPFDPFGGDIQVQTIDELAELLWNDRGGIAIIPTSAVDFRFRTLRVDGIDIFRHRGAPNPLLLRTYGVPEEVAPETLIRRETPAKLKFVGDIIFGRYVQVAMEQRNDFASPFRAIADELHKADLTIGDLECSLSDSFPQPERTEPHTFRFKTGTVTVEGLKLADIDILSRANNHSFDFGPVGMVDTSRTLVEAGIKHFGIGQNLEEARRPVIATVGDLSFAFLGYNGISDKFDGATADSPGTSPLIEAYVREDIQRAAAEGHIVIPFFHWGIEYVALPNEEQRHFARLAIDAGAAVVIGSHPHWVQAVEIYRGKPIIYSLGNSVFDQAWSRETMEGVIADIWFEGETVKGIDLNPVLIIEEHKPVLLDHDNAYHVLERIWDASETVRGWG